MFCLLFLLVEITSNLRWLATHMPCVIFSCYSQPMMFICFPIAPVPSLRPNVFSTTERDERIKIGLSESSGKKRKHFLILGVNIHNIILYVFGETTKK